MSKIFNKKAIFLAFAACLALLAVVSATLGLTQNLRASADETPPAYTRYEAEAGDKLGVSVDSSHPDANASNDQYVVGFEGA